MMNAKPRYFEETNRERSCASFIPYSSHVTPHTIVTKDGDYLRIWKVGGISHECADADDIQLRMDQLNTLLRSLGSDHVAIWTHNVRRKTTDRLTAHFDNTFCFDLDKKYYDSFAGYRMMANELYLTIVYRPYPSTLSKSFVKAGRRTLEELKRAQAAHLKKVDEIAFQVEASMKRYDVEALRVYEDDGGASCSQLLEFLNFLISGAWQKVRVPRAPLHDYLGNAWLFIGNETIEIRTPTTTRFAQAIDFKDYNTHTEPGMLNNLMYEDYEYVMTQSYSFFSKSEAKKYLDRQYNQLKNAEDGSITQLDEMQVAMDELIQGLFCLGEYHYSLMVFGDSIESVRRNTTSAMAIVQDLGFLAALVTTATDAAYYAQLPCNWFYRPRIAVLTSKNFAGLSSFHNFSAGKRDGNPWGQAVTLFKTPSGQPLYFNFHASHEDENAFDKKVLGNTRIIGQSGSGKTVLLGMLLCQAQKYKHNASTGYSEVFFDKDQGAKIAIMAIGGQYFSLKNGVPTGFNPFQLETTEDNILFLESLIKKLVAIEHQSLTTSDELRISHAVRTVMKMPKQLRRLTTITQNMTEGSDKSERENSLVKRLSRWCEGGSHAWVFDNPTDLLDFTSHSSYGFDGTAFLDNEAIRTPLAMYLLHRMESIIDGRRFIYYMDEFWKWLRDDAFSEFAFNKQKTIRKQNGLGVFATQSPSDVLKSDIARAIIEQCATEIYLPNPKADRDEYLQGFKLTTAEYDIIKNLGEDSRQFLVKQGHHAAIGQLDLRGFDDELSILSGSTDNLEIFDQLMEEVGDNPSVWLPLFYERLQTKRSVKSIQPAVLIDTH